YIYITRLNLFWTKYYFAYLIFINSYQIDQDYIIKFVTVSRSFNAVV
ncbi:unnamed protein product, partial [Brassica rapa subsp. trilocularis]